MKRKIFTPIALAIGIIMLAVSIEPSTGFSTVGNFFETNDIIFWLNFNDDYSDKSTNRFQVTAVDPAPSFTSSICYDEKSVIFTEDPYQRFDLNSQAAKDRLNLNTEDDFHVRISLWIDADEDWGSRAPGTMALASKYEDNFPQWYRGWEIELEDINTGFGRLRFKIDDWVDPNNLFSMVTLDPSLHFGENRDLFYNKTFVTAGWDFSPIQHDGFIWLKAVVKTDPDNFTVYRNYAHIVNLPSSTNKKLSIGDHCRNSPSRYVGIMDEFSITHGSPYDMAIINHPLDPETYGYSLPNENQTAYYNFENIEFKDSIIYDQEGYMFFDGAHVVPHNGMIVTDNFQSGGSLSWDGSDCFHLDGSSYGMIKHNIDGWGRSGGNFNLMGWPKEEYNSGDINNTVKRIEVGCVFKMEGESQNDQVLMSQFVKYVWLYGFDDYGYKIGIDSNNKLFADLAVNFSTTRTSVNSYTVQLNTWYKCLMSIEKYEIDDVYYIDAEIAIWEYSGGAWILRGNNTYSYSHPKYLDGFLWKINDISAWTSGDAIIGGTWDTHINMEVVDKFEGKIDDAKWYKSMAFDVRGFNKYHVYNAWDSGYP